MTGKPPTLCIPGLTSALAFSRSFWLLTITVTFFRSLPLLSYLLTLGLGLLFSLIAFVPSKYAPCRFQYLHLSREEQHSPGWENIGVLALPMMPG